ncbi:synaptonemal complex protein 2 [Fundulus heteroclitus]|uniref:synaptonemal complex protein 2 n=1 Tax=Fundulus heteroclitus TaxID=8078 RepID=UPI00165BED70|nr:synaptonemal complex protein 2 [Fundulus heteroclitus]
MLNKGNVIPGQEQARALKGSLAACQASLGPSPPPIEKMRSAKRSAPTLDLTCSTVLTPRGSPLPNSPCQDTPSPIQLLPRDRLTVSSKGQRKLSSFHDAAKKTSKTPSIQSVPSACSPACQTPAPSPPTGLTAAEMCAGQKHLSSAPQSLSSTQPLLTSTLLELDKPPVPSPPQSPFPGDNGCHLDLSKVSSVSLGSLSQSSPQSSVLSGKIKESSTGVLTMSFKENTPITDQDLELTHHLVSGPSRKRCVSTPSNPEEEEKKKSKTRAQRSPRMKPRKLFKSFAEVSVVDERSHVSCSHWEAEEVDADMEEDSELPEQTLNPNNLCQQLSSELKNKFQNHCKMVEIYNKQSSKAVQQHISSIGVQLKKNRVQRLSQVQNILLEEIQKMELDDNMLKSMEKDLTIYWKKQMTTFHSYQKQESKRNDTLRRTLQSVSGHNWDYEEGLFKSEMCLVKKDMKSIQDRLLSEMHEGEIQSVKRGLHALFFP